MANKEATLILKIKDGISDALKKVQGALGSVKSSVDNLGKAFMSHFVITAGDVVNAFKSIGGAMLDMVNDAAQFKNIETAFSNLAAAQGKDATAMLANMRELTNGTITDLELMKQANTAMLLGLPIDRFGEMLKVAQTSAKSTGQSMDFMLNSIVTGLGRGSKLMLDNLGILVDVDKAQADYARSLNKSASALTEAERKQAFINEALRVGLENSEKAGFTTLSFSEKIARLQVSMENLWIIIGSKLAPGFEFLAEKIWDSTKGIEEGVKQASALDATLIFLTKTMAIIVNFMAGMKGAASNVSGNAVDQAKKLLTLDIKGFFSGWWTSIKQGGPIVEGVKQAVTDQWQKMQEDLLRIDQLFGQKRLDGNATNHKANMDQKSAQSEEERVAEMEKYLAAEMLKQEQFAAEISQIDVQESQKLAARIAYIDKQIAADKQFHETRRLLAERAGLLQLQKQAKQNEEQVKIDKKATDDKKKEDELRERNRESTLNTIATMQGANNKVLATIGKAAAITQIAIDTPVAIGRALAAFPPPFNFGAAALVGAAMAYQASRVAGVQLAEGGIVRATPGGVQATIGEGGKDEAVIPLDDPETMRKLGGGSNVTIVVNGGLLGDESSAREFATAVDKELFKLRQNNSSIAFDSGFV